MKSRFFPMFMDIGEKKILFIGAGKIASRRVRVLSDFETNITIIAPEISEALQDVVDRETNVIHIIQTVSKNNLPEIVSDYDIVFACTDDYELNHEIYTICMEKEILVNNCSNHNECDFYFPGIVQKENVVVGVNAGGNAHSQAREIREKIQEVL